MEADIKLDAASDHGTNEGLYVRDPDGNGVELYWDRPRSDWPRNADGSLAVRITDVDLQSLLAEI